MSAKDAEGRDICDRCGEPIKTRGWRKGLPTPEVPAARGVDGTTYWTHPPANGGMFCDPEPYR